MFEIKKINKKIYQKRYAMLWQFGHFVTLGKMTFWTYCHHGHNIFWAFYHPGHFVILGLNVIWAFWLWAICHTWAFCHLGHFNIQSLLDTPLWKIIKYTQQKCTNRNEEKWCSEPENPIWICSRTLGPSLFFKPESYMRSSLMLLKCQFYVWENDQQWIS